MEGRGLAYVVDDDDSVRKGLSWLFASVEIEVKAFPSAEAFLDACVLGDRPACLLLDVRMPGVSGLDLLDLIRARDLPIPVIMLSGHGDIPMAVLALSRGAIDFIPKPGHEQLLLDRVQAAISANAECLRYRRDRASADKLFGTLSPREQIVLRLVSRGYLNKEIALELAISERTVESHRLNALRKLKIRAGAELTRLVGLVWNGEVAQCRTSVGMSCPACRAASWLGQATPRPAGLTN